MSYPKYIDYYASMEPVLDACLRSEVSRYKLLTAKQAYVWRAKAYMFRSLLRAKGITKYDTLFMQLEDNTVIISHNSLEQGTFSRPGAEGIVVTDPGMLRPSEEFEAEAFALARKLGVTKEEKK